MLNFAIELAHRAGAVLRARQEQERRVESKGFADVVTDADKASEALIVGAIRERYPEHGIVAEEGSGTAGSGEYQWLIDPLDGTLNYLHGMPIYCVSLALLRGASSSSAWSTTRRAASCSRRSGARERAATGGCLGWRPPNTSARPC
jgi:fructose-1,6-bisphosphatase/inositol monophosphatase family enzyme